MNVLKKDFLSMWRMCRRREQKFAVLFIILFLICYIPIDGSAGFGLWKTALMGIAVLDVIMWAVNASSVSYLFLACAIVELIAFAITLLRTPQFVFVMDRLVLNGIFTLGIALAFLNTP